MKQRPLEVKGQWQHIGGQEWFHHGHKANKGHSTSPLGDVEKAC